MCFGVFLPAEESWLPSQGLLLGLEGNLIILLQLSNCHVSFEQNPPSFLPPECLFPVSYFQSVLAFAL